MQVNFTEVPHAQFSERATSKRRRNHASDADVSDRSPSYRRYQARSSSTATYQFNNVEGTGSREWTLSVAIPASILDNAQTPDLKTYLVGQIARALVIFHVDEVIVFKEDSEKKSLKVTKMEQNNGDNTELLEVFTPSRHKSNFDSHNFMAHILEYLEAPQYLRRSLFPVHDNLKYAGLLNPVDAPHHCRKMEKSLYREGIVLDPKKDPQVLSAKSQAKRLKLSGLADPISPTENADKQVWIECGLDRPVKCLSNIDIEPNTRVTCKFDEKTLELISKKTNSRSSFHGKIKDKKRGIQSIFYPAILVSPTEPRMERGIYWGYNVRRADSLTKVFSECPFESGYDLTIGTSERGHSIHDLPPMTSLGSSSLSTENSEELLFQSKFKDSKRILVVFGGLHGIESCIDGDADLTAVSPEEAHKLFDLWLNTCPNQGSRTIRSEEAILITLSWLRPLLIGIKSRL